MSRLLAPVRILIPNSLAGVPLNDEVARSTNASDGTGSYQPDASLIGTPSVMPDCPAFHAWNYFFRSRFRPAAEKP